MLFPKIIKTAHLSGCLKFRFSLNRTWDEDAPQVCWIGLNPSTADTVEDDPTIRRMMGFARSWKCGSIVVVNLFARRSPDPAAIDPKDEPTEDNNAAIIDAAMGSEKTVACWGAHQHAVQRAREVNALLYDVGLKEMFCLGETKDGHPRHPLYVPQTHPLMLYLGTGSHVGTVTP